MDATEFSSSAELLALLESPKVDTGKRLADIVTSNRANDAKELQDVLKHKKITSASEIEDMPATVDCEYLLKYLNLKWVTSTGDKVATPNGKLPLSQLQAALPGGSGTQRNSSDKQSGAAGVPYHLSVAFSASTPVRGKVQMATVSRVHVSFKDENLAEARQPRFWWSVQKGELGSMSQSGQFPAGVDIKDLKREARALVDAFLPRINCYW